MAATAGEPFSATAALSAAAVAEDGQVVTPFEVSAKDGGKIDYDKIVAAFDLRLVGDGLVSRVERLTGRPTHHLLRRLLFFAHRDFDAILDAYEKGEKFYVYMSRCPSLESLHLGHLAVFMSSCLLSIYWDWSWDELVTYELPALVNHVHSQTGQKIYYVGHSLNLYVLGTDKFDPRGNAISALLSTALTLFISIAMICCHPSQRINCFLNPSTNDVFMANEPQPTSSKTMVHLMQTVTKFDYGSNSKNMKHYGSKNTPVYPLEKIPSDFPLFFAYGGKESCRCCRREAPL